MENYSFFALLFRQKYINRWSLMRCSTEENLSTHSMETAVIAHCLAVINRDVFSGGADPDKVAVYALFHDSSEVLCGDLPSPVKYSGEELKNAYKKIEEESAKSLLSKLPNELKSAYESPVYEKADPLTHRLVKTADKLCALIKCIEEIKCGNLEFTSAEKSIRENLKEYESRELEYFTEHFLPSFGKTLDEL